MAIYHGTVVCVACEREFSSSAPGGKSGVIVRVMMSNDTQVGEIRKSDIWICPGCGVKILKGWGEPLARHYDGPGFRQALYEWDEANKKGEAFTIWEKGKPDEE